MFQSKIFRRIFFSYVIIICSCLVIYSSFIIYENYQVTKAQVNRQSELQLEEIANLIDSRLWTAQNIVQNITYSSTLKKLYMSEKVGTSLDSYSLFAIQEEMKNIGSIGGISVYKTFIFIGNSKRAYSNGGTIYLDSNFEYKDKESSFIGVGNINELFGFDSKRYSFGKQFLIYCSPYTYQNGQHIGTICVAFDMVQLENDIKKLLNDGYGLKVSYGEQILFENGNTNGQIFSRNSIHDSQICISVFADKKVFATKNIELAVILLIISLISVVYIIQAYWVSKSYYKPIDNLEQIIPFNRNIKETENELTTITQSVIQLIDEKDEYHKKMLRIAPYAKTGMLHSIMCEDMGYYFPEDFNDRLKEIIQNKDSYNAHHFLTEIYEQNKLLEGSQEMYKSLFDELYVSVTQVLWDITQKDVTHLTIEKPSKSISLEEVFEYYESALLSIIEELSVVESAEQRLDNDIIKFIQQHIMDADLSGQMISDKFHVSAKYISLLFKERFEMTYIQYIQTKRIQNAAGLLKTGRFSLSEVATMCGYTNALTFRRNFKAVMGVNPSEYCEDIDEVG